jgi:Ca-activated chloride channel family protein
VFADNLTGALEVVGRDVKIQVAFNPAVVKSYRLIGYANRDVKDADFRNDAVDGGEIGSGHAATALFEIKLHDDAQGEVARATVRYRTDEEGEFSEIHQDFFTAQVATAWEQAEPGLRLAANAAELAEILGEVFYAKHAKLDPIVEDLETINPSLRSDKANELLQLAMKARELKK